MSTKHKCWVYSWAYYPDTGRPVISTSHRWTLKGLLSNFSKHQRKPNVCYVVNREVIHIFTYKEAERILKLKQL